MTTELKEAIRTIAEYDGWVLFDAEVGWCWRKDGAFITNHFGLYHFSADALLPVWRKVREDIQKSKYNYWRTTNIDRVGQMYILDGQYPKACIQLASIINQLKERWAFQQI